MFVHKPLTVLLSPEGIYKQMMSDKRYGLTINIIATKVLPALTPVVVSPNLKLDEVRGFSTGRHQMAHSK